MYISCLVTITQALLSLGSDGRVWVVPRYLFIYKPSLDFQVDYSAITQWKHVLADIQNLNGTCRYVQIFRKQKRQWIGS